MRSGASSTGRIPIRTGIRRPDELDGTWQKVRDEAAAGHRTFVVVPLIEEGAEGVDDAMGSSAVAAETEAVRLRELLAPLRVGLVHGRMKPADRDAEMRRFRDGELDALIQTRETAAITDQPMTPMVDNLVVEVTGAESSLAELVGDVDRGLLLTCLWYIREVDPQTLLLTGLTRDGVYMVEGGEITAAVNNFRFNESPVDLLDRLTAASVMCTDASISSRAHAACSAGLATVSASSMSFTRATRCGSALVAVMVISTSTGWTHPPRVSSFHPFS